MKIVLGTMTFSDQVNATDTAKMLDLFAEHNGAEQGGVELDTAYMYNDGKTEVLLGDLLGSNQDTRFEIATKANPWSDGNLKPDTVRNQFNTSLNRMQVESIDMLYLHSPDLETPIEDTLSACAELFEQGKFKRFALSNFAAWQVAEVVEVCRKNAWMVPTVYQGMYNALTRDVERELFPCLRNYGMSFYVYNPLAGGMLTGKHKALTEEPQDGRFHKFDGYKSRYWKSEYFDVLDKYIAVCDHHQISPTEAALNWLVNHSCLSDEAGDAIILGASKLDHLSENISAMGKGDLPEDIIDVLDQGWEKTRPNVKKYFRP